MSLQMFLNLLFSSDSSFSSNQRFSLPCCYLMADTFLASGGRDFEVALKTPILWGL